MIKDSDDGLEKGCGIALFVVLVAFGLGVAIVVFRGIVGL
jgi:hypothetical protein